MNLALMIYLIGVIDEIGACFVFLLIFLGLFIVIGTIYLVVNDSFKIAAEEKKLKDKIKTSIIYFIIILTFTSFIPNSKTIAAMYLVPKLINNEELKKIPDKALTLINGKFDEWINNLTDKKGEKK